MANRITGLSSGLDTEALVSAMVSNYTAKVTKNQKAQSKLQYKMDALKSINTDVYNLFNSVDKLRWSSAYSLKSTTVSDATKAKVSAGNTAVNGTQTLKIDKLAQAGYLTGGNVKSDSALKSDSKLSSIYTMSGTEKNEYKGGSISVTVGGKETTIQLTDDMTATSFVNKLKDAGLNASFDEKNGRFFISSKNSGEKNDFTLVANDANGLSSLRSMGLYTSNDAAKEEYTKWSTYTDDQINDLVSKRYEASKTTYESKAKAYLSSYNNAVKAQETAEKAIEKLNKDNEGGKSAVEQKLTEAKDKLDALKTTDYWIDSGDVDEDGNPIYKWDENKLKEDGRYEDYKAAEAEVKKYQDVIDSYDKQEKALETANDDITKYEAYISFDGDGKAIADSSNAAMISEVDTANTELEAKIRAEIEARRTASTDMLNGLSSIPESEGAVRLEGSDAEIVLNGASYTSATNSFSVNGLSIEATAKTDGDITITTATDSQGIYDKIKDFLQSYNDVINKINKLYNAPSAKGYDPLTEEERAEMSDTEISKWESKIKDSILRRDDTLSGIINAMTNPMSKVFDIGGKNYSLSSFGIKTLGYFSSANNENYAYHIDGDADDSATSGNSDKLMAAIIADPDSVVSFFQKLSSSLYDGLNAKMKSTTLSSAYTIYNDKEMASEYSSYTSTISKWQDKVADMEDAYFKKFSSMEKMLSKLQSQTTSLSSYFG